MVRVSRGDFLVLPLLDGFRQETGFFVGIRCVVVFTFERLQRIVAGLGLRMCVVWGMMIPSDDTEMGTQDAAMHKTFYRSPGIASKRIFCGAAKLSRGFISP